MRLVFPSRLGRRFLATLCVSGPRPSCVRLQGRGNSRAINRTQLIVQSVLSCGVRECGRLKMALTQGTLKQTGCSCVLTNSSMCMQKTPDRSTSDSLDDVVEKLLVMTHSTCITEPCLTTRAQVHRRVIDRLLHIPALLRWLSRVSAAQCT
jgi:hypothetical protein